MATVIETATAAFNILKVVLGLGFVIFLHELGHFLAAKWNGVKVDKFFLGFDFFGLKIATFKYGETLYGIGAFPLGGYVAMHGEHPEEDAEKITDPRAFINKSVGARLVIMTAGVVMNLILGVALFSITYMIGVAEMPAVLGAVQAGSPAFEAGLRPGDEIVSIDGKGDVHYTRLRMKVSLSGIDQTIYLGVNRPGVSETLTIPVVPKRQAKADMPNIGVLPAESLDLFEKTPYDAPPGLDGAAPMPASLPGGGRVVEAGPQAGSLVKVDDVFALNRILAENRDKPVVIKTLKKPAKEETSRGPATFEAVLPPSRVMTFGLRLTPGSITSIQHDSIAEKAGFRKGDRIVKVNGRDDFDPMRLPDDVFDHAGKAMVFTVERTDDGKPRSIEISATPEAAVPWTEPPLRETEALKVLGLGLAMEVLPKIAAVAEGSPAAKAGIKPGSTLQGVVFPPDKKADAKTAKPTRFTFEELPPTNNGGFLGGISRFAKRLLGGTKPEEEPTFAAWPFVFQLVQNLPIASVDLLVSGSTARVSATPVPDPSWSNVLRGLNFIGMVREIPPQPLVAAARRGMEETYENVISIYAMIRSLFQGRVGSKNLAGLPRITGIAYQAASMGIVPLLQFLGMLSINLAVLNFLPIPPLDGGQIAFLLAEKIRGKPLPDSTLSVLMIVGFSLVIMLMLYTILQDLFLMIFG